MYKQRIMQLVLTAVLCTSAGINLNAGDYRKDGWDTLLEISTIGLVTGATLITFSYWWHGITPKLGKTLDVSNRYMEVSTDNLEVLRDRNVVWLSENIGAYEDEYAKEVFSDWGRKACALARDRQRGDKKLTELLAVKEDIKIQREARSAKSSWWSYVPYFGRSKK